MNYENPSILLTQPAPGHYVITGHHPATVPSPEGTIVPLETCYIAPEVPSAILFGILGDRDFDGTPFESSGQEPAAAADEIKRLTERVAALEQERDALIKKLAAPKGGKK
jgi:hypothetical protein